MNKYENRIIQEDMKILEDTIDWNQLNNTTILITGANGMIASYIVYFLIYLNENVKNFNCKIILVARSYDKCYNRFGKYIEKNYISMYFENLNNEININEKVDYIFHAASIATTQYFETNPIDVIMPNSIGTYRLLEFATKNNVKSFLFFSSGSVYGKVKDKDVITEEDFGGLDPLDVNSCYSESKRFGESLCKAYYKQKNINTKIVRINHTYGPTIDLDSDKRVFSEFIKNIVERKNIELKSDGKAVRNFTYITDAISAFFKILLDGESGEAYNLSNENTNISIIELAETLVNIYKDFNIKLVKSVKDDKYNENKFANEICFSNEKLKKLGWSCKFNIEEGFKRTIESFK